MAEIRSKNTRPEILVRTLLHKHGIRFRLGSRIGKIRPDVLLRKHRVAIFVHGCFWHQHKGCKLAYSDREYSVEWCIKFTKNRDRDQRTLDELSSRNWRSAIIWECATRDENELLKTVEALKDFILDDSASYFESTYRRT